MNVGYIKSLDGVRSIAIILVMTFHFGMNHYGWIGVQLFFVLSGFLITGILWNEKHKPTKLSEKFKKFWARRSLRIFPLYYAFLFACGLGFLFFNFPSYYPTYIPYLATYTVNFSRTLPEWHNSPLFTHLWSLSVEEQFYLFFPLIIFFAPGFLIRKLMLFFIVAAPLIRFFLGKFYIANAHSASVVADAVYWNILSHIDAFFIGGAIHIFSLTSKIKNPGRLVAGSFMAVVLAGAISFYCSNVGSYYTDLGYGHGKISNYEHVWHYSVLNIFFASLLLYLVSPVKNKWLHKLLENEWLVRIGRVSYGMYIFHWAILYYFFQAIFDITNIWTQIPLFILYLVIVYGVAELSFRLFEMPFIRLKDRFFPSKK